MKIICKVSLRHGGETTHEYLHHGVVERNEISDQIQISADVDHRQQDLSFARYTYNGETVRQTRRLNQVIPAAD